MSTTRLSVSGLVSRFAGRLRFPQLLAVTGALFLLDLFIPDLIPFVDEVILGLATLLFATWKKRKADRVSPGSSSSGENGGGVDAPPTDTDG